MSDEVKQAPAVPDPFAPGSLLVTVVFLTGAPVAGAEVSVTRGDLMSKAGVTDANGEIAFKDLPPADYDLKIVFPGHGLAPDTGKVVVGPVTGTVHVNPGPAPTVQPVTLAAPNVAFLRVTVKNEKAKLLSKVPVDIDALGGQHKLTNAGVAMFGPLPAPSTVNILAGNTDFAAKPHITKANSAPNAVVFERASSTGVLSEAQISDVVMQLAEFKLEITKIDANFAPSVETCDITFAIKGLAKRKVTLTIEGENYAGKTIVQRDLGDAEGADGEHNVIAFTGKIEVGANKDQFISPLMGPFKVRLEHVDSKNLGILKSEKPFKVLYHSLLLGFGKHTADEAEPPEADQVKFTQFKLNDFGFDAGPVTGTLDAVTQAAIRRFERANYLPGATAPAPETGAVSGNLIQMIKTNPRKQDRFESGATPLTKDCKYYVYDNFTADRTGTVATGTTPEFLSEAGFPPPGAAKRPSAAEDKMTPGFIPLEVEVRLLNKKKQPVSAPDAIGSVPVAWEVADTPEDDSVILGAPAKEFVKNARTFGNPGGVTGTAALAGAARIDDSGDNCPVAFGGRRPPTADAYIKVWFPDDAGSKLAPYSISGYDTDIRDGKTFHQALTPVWIHPTDFPKRRGKAGVYLRMSTKGGDNAKVRVSLSFKGLPNKAQLEADHQEALKKDLVKETGRWTVWRRSRVASYCPQIPPVRHIGEPQFAGVVRDLWKEAYIEFESGGAPLRRLVYTDVVDQAKYNQAILALPAQAQPNAGLNPAGTGPLTAADLTFRATSLYGGPPFRNQNPGEDAENYVWAVGRSAANWIDPSSITPAALSRPNGASNAILSLFHIETRKQQPEGYAILDYRTHEPISGQDWDPTLPPPPGPPVGPPGNFKPTANPAARNFVFAHRGWMNADGAVTMSVDNESDINEYIVHECSHARFLQHHEVKKNGTSDFPFHHDAAQSRCIMSYDVPPDQFGKRSHYHFCGKCILKLRGWSVLLLPNKYA